VRGVTVLTLEGTPRERGQAYGESLRKEIKALIDSAKEHIGLLWGMNPDEYIKHYVRNSNHLAAVERWTPKLLEELQGIAEGADVEFEILFGINCVILDDGYLDRLIERVIKERFGIIDQVGNQCSTIGVFGQESYSAVLAQNCDNPAFFEGLQVILRIKHEDSDLESIIFTVAGGLCLNGMNNSPLGIVTNLLPQLNSSLDGLPYGFILRGILEQRSLDDAIRFLCNIKHARGFNFMIGDACRIVDFECSANRVSKFAPYEGATRLYHTNHPLVNDDKKWLYRIFDNDELRARIIEELPHDQRRCVKEARLSDTQIRYEFLKSQLEAAPAPITVSRIKSILGAHDKIKGYEVPICKHRNAEHRHSGYQWSTTGCSIMELSDSPKFHFAPGPPCSTPFYTYEF